MLELAHKWLDVWNAAIELTSAIYYYTNSFPKEELYGLTSQIRRATISIPSNISESVSRANVKERKRFYEIARSSLVELDTQLIIAQKLDYLTEIRMKELDE